MAATPAPAPASAAVRVLVRCRPLLSREASGASASLRIDRSASTVSMGSLHAGSEKQFKFDAVADMTCTQDDVYALGHVGELVGSTLGGYHATIFAYGQTASGKTFTMEGFEYGRDRLNKPTANFRTERARLGVIPRAIDELFARLRATGEPGVAWRVRCSYFQLYKEHIYDLLSGEVPADGGALTGVNRRRGLKLRYTKARDFYVENLSEYEIRAPEDAFELFQRGVGVKAMAETHLNTASSRSHCLLQLHVDTIDADSAEVAHTGTLSLVDLAGSERQPKGVEKSHNIADSVEINRSLFALRKVIVALADGPRRKPHVPYRDSVLTRVLKHSLGGVARTLMVACISPADSAAEESLSTLAYAARARAITNTLVVNADPKLVEIRRLREEVSALRSELERLRRLLELPDAEARALALGATGDGVGLLVGSPAAPARAHDAAEPALAPSAPQAQALVQSSAAARSAGGGGARAAANGTAGGVDPATHRQLGERFVESVGALRASMESNAKLRDAFDAVAAKRDAAERAHAEVLGENSELRERVQMLEAVVMMETYPEARPARGAEATAAPSPADASDLAQQHHRQQLGAELKRAVQAAIMLRLENDELRDRLDAAEAGGAAAHGGGGARGARAPGSAALGPRPGTAAARSGAQQSGPNPAQGAGAEPRPAGGPAAPSVARVSSAGRLLSEHDLLLRSSDLFGGPAAELDTLHLRGAPLANVAVAEDTHGNLDQLAALLRRRSDLSRHTQLIASLSKHRSASQLVGADGGAAALPPPPPPPPAAPTARTQAGMAAAGHLPPRPGVAPHDARGDYHYDGRQHGPPPANGAARGVGGRSPYVQPHRSRRRGGWIQ